MNLNLSKIYDKFVKKFNRRKQLFFPQAMKQFVILFNLSHCKTNITEIYKRNSLYYMYYMRNCILISAKGKGTLSFKVQNLLLDMYTHSF